MDARDLAQTISVDMEEEIGAKAYVKKTKSPTYGFYLLDEGHFDLLSCRRG